MDGDAAAAALPPGDDPVPVKEAARAWAPLLAYKQALWTFAGSTEGGPRNDICRFDPLSGEWAVMGCTGPKPQPRLRHCSVIKDGKLVIYGGEDGCGLPLGDMWAVPLLPRRPQERRWRRLQINLREAAPVPSLTGAAATMGWKNRAMLIHGGLGAANVQSHTLYHFIFESQVWGSLEPHQGGPGPLLHGHSLHATRDAIWAYGGFTYRDGDAEARNTQVFVFLDAPRMWRSVRVDFLSRSAPLDFEQSRSFVSTLPNSPEMVFAGRSGGHAATLPSGAAVTASEELPRLEFRPRPPIASGVVGSPAPPPPRDGALICALGRTVWFLFGEATAPNGELVTYCDVNAYAVDRSLWVHTARAAPVEVLPAPAPGPAASAQCRSAVRLPHQDACVQTPRRKKRVLRKGTYRLSACRLVPADLAHMVPRVAGMYPLPNTPSPARVLNRNISQDTACSPVARRQLLRERTKVHDHLCHTLTALHSYESLLAREGMATAAAQQLSVMRGNSGMTSASNEEKHYRRKKGRKRRDIGEAKAWASGTQSHRVHWTPADGGSPSRGSPSRFRRCDACDASDEKNPALGAQQIRPRPVASCAAETTQQQAPLTLTSPPEQQLPPQQQQRPAGISSAQTDQPLQSWEANASSRPAPAPAAACGAPAAGDERAPAAVLSAPAPSLRPPSAQDASCGTAPLTADSVDKGCQGTPLDEAPSAEEPRKGGQRSPSPPQLVSPPSRALDRDARHWAALRDEERQREARRERLHRQRALLGGTRPALRLGNNHLHTYIAEPVLAPYWPMNPNYRRAVVIGIDYRGQRVEAPGAVDAARRLAQRLQPHYQVYLLTEDNDTVQPTRAAIEDALRWLCTGLTPDCGQTVLLAFAGHNSQRWDSDGGLDEAICPVDFAPNSILTDADLRELTLARIPKGNRFMAIIDTTPPATVLDLPYYSVAGFDTEMVGDQLTDGNSVACDALVISGCNSLSDSRVGRDYVEQHAQRHLAGGGGALISALLASLATPAVPSLQDALRETAAELRRAAAARPRPYGVPAAPVTPQLSASRPYDTRQLCDLLGDSGPAAAAPARDPPVSPPSGAQRRTSVLWDPSATAQSGSQRRGSGWDPVGDETVRRPSAAVFGRDRGAVSPPPPWQSHPKSPQQCALPAGPVFTPAARGPPPPPAPVQAPPPPAPVQAPPPPPPQQPRGQYYPAPAEAAEFIVSPRRSHRAPDSWTDEWAEAGQRGRAAGAPPQAEAEERELLSPTQADAARGGSRQPHPAHPAAAAAGRDPATAAYGGGALPPAGEGCTGLRSPQRAAARAYSALPPAGSGLPPAAAAGSALTPAASALHPATAAGSDARLRSPPPTAARGGGALPPAGEGPLTGLRSPPRSAARILHRAAEGLSAAGGIVSAAHALPADRMLHSPHTNPDGRWAKLEADRLRAALATDNPTPQVRRSVGMIRTQGEWDALQAAFRSRNPDLSGGDLQRALADGLPRRVLHEIRGQLGRSSVTWDKREAARGGRASTEPLLRSTPISTPRVDPPSLVTALYGSLEAERDAAFAAAIGGEPIQVPAEPPQPVEERKSRTRSARVVAGPVSGKGTGSSEPLWGTDGRVLSKALSPQRQPPAELQRGGQGPVAPQMVPAQRQAQKREEQCEQASWIAPSKSRSGVASPRGTSRRRVVEEEEVVPEQADQHSEESPAEGGEREEVVRSPAEVTEHEATVPRPPALTQTQGEPSHSPQQQGGPSHSPQQQVPPVAEQQLQDHTAISRDRSTPAGPRQNSLHVSTDLDRQDPLTPVCPQMVEDAEGHDAEALDKTGHLRLPAAGVPHDAAECLTPRVDRQLDHLARFGATPSMLEALGGPPGGRQSVGGAHGDGRRRTQPQTDISGPRGHRRRDTAGSRQSGHGRLQGVMSELSDSTDDPGWLVGTAATAAATLTVACCVAAPRPQDVAAQRAEAIRDALEDPDASTVIPLLFKISGKLDWDLLVKAFAENHGDCCDGDLHRALVVGMQADELAVARRHLQSTGISWTPAPPEPAPVGDVCIAFADVQGHAELFENCREGMMQGLDIYTTLMRRLIKENRGYEVRTEGDLFMVAFARPEDALQWGLRVQTCMLRERWPEELSAFADAAEEVTGGQTLRRGLRVRIGIATGRAESAVDSQTKRTDYSGDTVTAAARIAGTAQGGEIVCTGAFQHRVAEAARKADVEQVALPQRRFKGDARATERWRLLPGALRMRRFEPDTAISRVASMELSPLSAQSSVVGGSLSQPGSILGGVVTAADRFVDWHQRGRKDEDVPPRGDVALVFTDVQSSTNLWDTEEASMWEALEDHNNLMRELIKKNNGYEVKTEGDAFMVAFHRPSDAVCFCRDVQTGLLKIAWPEAILRHKAARTERDAKGRLVWNGLRVRCGVHWGRPGTQRDPTTRRTDYFGPMVNVAARVGGAAQGGEIVCSMAVANAIQGDPTLGGFAALGVSTISLGEKSFKGVSAAMEVLRVVPEALASREFAEPQPSPAPSPNMSPQGDPPAERTARNRRQSGKRFEHMVRGGTQRDSPTRVTPAASGDFPGRAARWRRRCTLNAAVSAVIASILDAVCALLPAALTAVPLTTPDAAAAPAPAVSPSAGGTSAQRNDTEAAAGGTPAQRNGTEAAAETGTGLRSAFAQPRAAGAAGVVFHQGTDDSLRNIAFRPIGETADADPERGPAAVRSRSPASVAAAVAAAADRMRLALDRGNTAEVAEMCDAIASPEDLTQLMGRFWVRHSDCMGGDLPVAWGTMLRPGSEERAAAERALTRGHAGDAALGRFAASALPLEEYSEGPPKLRGRSPSPLPLRSRSQSPARSPSPAPLQALQHPVLANPWERKVELAEEAASRPALSALEHPLLLQQAARVPLPLTPPGGAAGEFQQMPSTPPALLALADAAARPAAEQSPSQGGAAAEGPGAASREAADALRAALTAEPCDEQAALERVAAVQSASDWNLLREVYAARHRGADLSVDIVSSMGPRSTAMVQLHLGRIGAEPLPQPVALALSRMVSTERTGSRGATDQLATEPMGAEEVVDCCDPPPLPSPGAPTAAGDPLPPQRRPSRGLVSRRRDQMTVATDTLTDAESPQGSPAEGDGLERAPGDGAHPAHPAHPDGAEVPPPALPATTAAAPAARQARSLTPGAPAAAPPSAPPAGAPAAAPAESPAAAARAAGAAAPAAAPADAAAAPATPATDPAPAPASPAGAPAVAPASPAATVAGAPAAAPASPAGAPAAAPASPAGVPAAAPASPAGFTDAAVGTSPVGQPLPYSHAAVSPAPGSPSFRGADEALLRDTDARLRAAAAQPEVLERPGGNQPSTPHPPPPQVPAWSVPPHSKAPRSGAASPAPGGSAAPSSPRPPAPHPAAVGQPPDFAPPAAPPQPAGVSQPSPQPEQPQQQQRAPPSRVVDLTSPHSPEAHLWGADAPPDVPGLTGAHHAALHGLRGPQGPWPPSPPPGRPLGGGGEGAGSQLREPSPPPVLPEPPPRSVSPPPQQLPAPQQPPPQQQQQQQQQQPRPAHAPVPSAMRPPLAPTHNEVWAAELIGDFVWLEGGSPMPPGRRPPPTAAQLERVLFALAGSVGAAAAFSWRRLWGRRRRRPSVVTALCLAAAAAAATARNSAVVRRRGFPALTPPP